MLAHPPGRRMLIAYMGLYLAFAAAAARAVFELQGIPKFGYMLGLLAIYLLLLLVEPFLILRSHIFLHAINILQTGITLLLLVDVGELDYFAMLFIPPCTQSILHFSRRAALVWIGLICLLMVIALAVSFPASESIGYVIIYPTAIFLFTSLSYLAMQAQESQYRSEMLLTDLQRANLQLQVYANQVQELAAANERNRLARELHDSVTQIIFGLTLSAQAARILLDRNPARAAEELDHIQILAKDALAEMRALIQELHPRSPVEDGLVSALRRLVGECHTNNKLTCELNVKGDWHLTSGVESELYRVAQEALNNICKHAHTDRASITLDLENERSVNLMVEDNGIGFDLSGMYSQPGHLGLASMNERVQALGGKLIIDSRPGAGTRLQVVVPKEHEVQHA